MTVTPAPPVCDDQRIFPRLIDLLGCLKGEFDACGYDLCYLGLQSGQLADLTAIGESGSMGWVRLASMSPMTADTRTCSFRLTVEIEVGFATCYDISEDGQARSVQEDLALAKTLIDAQMLLLRALTCCTWTQSRKDYVIDNWQPIGPEGLVVGGTWTARFDV